MRARKTLVLMALLGLTLSLRAEDWPTYRHDIRRSGVSGEKLDAPRLGIAWTFRSAHPPVQAWAGPAKWDAYARIRGLRAMRNYDPVFHTIVQGDDVYFGSSADDTLRRLDARSGEERWSFTTDGPIRIAPSTSDGKVYFGSDDGHAYCVDADSGALLWKVRPAPAARKILHNGRLISFWPCRTGVLVDRGTAYFANGLLPWKESYLCAVDARTGSSKGEGRFVQTLQKVSLEGALLASPGRLFVPQGRVEPLVFARADGSKLGKLQGGGGCFVLLTEDAHVLHGPGNKTGWITDSDAKKLTKVAVFKNGNTLVVEGNVAYVSTDVSLAAVDRKARKPIWQVASKHPYDLILVGDTLFAGGEDSVAAYSSRDGSLLWSHAVEGKAYGLSAGAGRLFVSTDTGAIHAFDETDPAQRRPEARGDARGEDRRAGLTPVTEVDDPDLLHRWVFREDLRRGLRVRDLAGNQPAEVRGRSSAFKRLEDVTPGPDQALELDDATRVVVLEDHSKGKLPSHALTAEAWVRVDEGKTWGGIVGALQDNGDYEKGWLLGYNERRFSMALAGVSGTGRMTYLKAPTDFVAGRWYHVAGTYDGETIVLYVDGELAARSADQKGNIDYPPRAPFEIGAYHDDDEDFKTAGAIHEVRVYARALEAAEVREHAGEKVFRNRRVEEIAPGLGPYLSFPSSRSAEIRWRTARAVPTVLSYAPEGTDDERARRIEDAAPRRDHVVRLEDLDRNRVYRYWIELGSADGKRERTKRFECDTFFNFTLAAVPKALDPYAGEAAGIDYAAAAERILRMAGQDRGLCLDLGCGDGRLAYEIARRSSLRVIGVDTDAEKVKRAREMLKRAGVYGWRVAVYHVPSLSQLPFTGHFANIIISSSTLLAGSDPPDADELARLLRPAGGTAVLGRLPGSTPQVSRDAFLAWLRSTSLELRVEEEGGQTWGRLVRGPLPDSGVWSHQYGRADNSAYGGESLHGAKRTGDLEVQWIGRPGPRAQPDRNGRKPAPLSINGRLFTQGLNRLIGLDAYNGFVLWSLEIPPLARFNVPRDTSNWCADPDYVYAAVGDRCWRIDASRGELVKTYDVIAAKDSAQDYDWGYIASQPGLLLGTAVRSGAVFTNFWGGGTAGWYDAKAGPVTFKVSSDRLFALDKTSGALRWTYEDGVIVNSTIAIGDGRVFFVESRNPDAKKSADRRFDLEVLSKDRFLVAIDLASGVKLWEQPGAFELGRVACYLAHGDGQLVLVSTGDGAYRIFTFDGSSGRPLWKKSFPWKDDHHGAHMSRPALVGGKLYVRPRVFELGTGKKLDVEMPGGSCGTYAATDRAFFFRSGNVTVWERDENENKTTSWHRLRPDCWLSTIPAGGMLLSPEGGGGCSCGSWLETSIGFKPRALE